MRSKEEIISFYKSNYKPCFLLAWLRFLSYDELKKIDMLEPFDAAIAAHQVKSSKDWNTLVVQYNEKNLLFGLCILMRKLYNAIISKNITMASIYANDVANWLYILEDNKLVTQFLSNQDDIISYYNEVSKKYKIEN